MLLLNIVIDNSKQYRTKIIDSNKKIRRSVIEKWSQDLTTYNTYVSINNTNNTTT